MSNGVAGSTFLFKIWIAQVRPLVVAKNYHKWENLENPPKMKDTIFLSRFIFIFVKLFVIYLCLFMFNRKIPYQCCLHPRDGHYRENYKSFLVPFFCIWDMQCSKCRSPVIAKYGYLTSVHTWLMIKNWLMINPPYINLKNSFLTSSIIFNFIQRLVYIF